MHFTPFFEFVIVVVVVGSLIVFATAVWSTKRVRCGRAVATTATPSFDAWLLEFSKGRWP